VDDKPQRYNDTKDGGTQRRHNGTHKKQTPCAPRLASLPDDARRCEWIPTTAARHAKSMRIKSRMNHA